jgi:hypothetical protein
MGNNDGDDGVDLTGMTFSNPRYHIRILSHIMLLLLLLLLVAVSCNEVTPTS